MRSREKIVIVGGGLAGLSTACYARMQGFDTVIVEHGPSLGGVCTAWQRGPYTVDGCLHWLTGGPFTKIYEELGIIPPVRVRPLDSFATYRDSASGWTTNVDADLNALRFELASLSPVDAPELARLIEGARAFAGSESMIERPPELQSLRDGLGSMWRMRSLAGPLIHFRKPLGVWAREHLRDERLQQLFLSLFPGETPTFFLLMVLGYLEKGWLLHPVGGTARFREAIVDRHHELGGEAVCNATVEEILVDDDRAYGVRLTDGSTIESDLVVSTASGPETVLRLLAGRYGAEEMRTRLAKWKLFQPIVLLTLGVAQPFADWPATTIIDNIAPLRVGGFDNDRLYLRVYHADPEGNDGYAPAGHSVVQVLLQTEYDWWASRGVRYEAEKDEVALRLLERLEPLLPGLTLGVRMLDMATPLTFWRHARSWRGAYEGWMPSADAVFGHVPKTLPGLRDFYMAGQWVEPGGGVPTALMSGRQLVQILCERTGRSFSADRQL
ncbi:MAG TPA: NAD(P)/FAD-dependent oxidoreductase [Polyangia bacterium]